MHRRRFLRGMLLGAPAAAGIANIQLATPEEAKSLNEGDWLLVGPEDVPRMPDLRGSGEMFMKDDKGKYFLVGYLQEFRVEAQTVDVTSHWEGTVNIINPTGLMRAMGRFSSR